MKQFRILLAALLISLVLVSPASAVGTVVFTAESVGNGVRKYTIVWTSDASGNVSANSLRFNVERGNIISIEMKPGTAGDQPTDLYDLTFINSNSVDLLAGAGANLSNVTTKLTLLSPQPYYDGTYQLDITIAAAGNAKKGTIIFLVGPR
jgi:hypothetical protein